MSPDDDRSAQPAPAPAKTDHAEGNEGATGSVPTPAPQTFDRKMLEALVCPDTHARLSYDAKRHELVSKAAHLAYPIRGGIPIMLIDEARQLD